MNIKIVVFVVLVIVLVIVICLVNRGFDEDMFYR